MADPVPTLVSGLHTAHVVWTLFGGKHGSFERIGRHPSSLMASSTSLRVIPVFWHVLGVPWQEGHGGPAAAGVEVVCGPVQRCNPDIKACRSFPCSRPVISLCTT